MDALSLDQFAVFATIVEEGSFAAAARRMNRAQSAITYAIQKLEEQSGVELFDRSAYRPTLTEAGKALLPRARRILTDLEEYRLHAQRMTKGLEDDLTIVIHPFAPPSLFSAVFHEFNKEFPSVRINASPSARDVALEALNDGRADLAIVHNLVSLGESFEGRVCAQVELVAAASRDHPLASVEGVIQNEQLHDHTQLAVYGILSGAESHLVRGFGMDGINLWRVMDFEILHDLLLAGIGWGSVPRSRIEKDLADRRLVLLRPEAWGHGGVTLNVPLAVARAKSRPPGPAARWLFERFSLDTTR